MAAAVALVSCVRPDEAHPTLPGDQLFAACNSCHGDQGEGNPTLGIRAPAIAHLPAWYVEAQLVKFRTGARGAHPDDFEGLRMRPMSRQMMNAAEVRSVSDYVSRLPAVKPLRSIEAGDPAKGHAAFALCATCHGPDGRGMLDKNAPPLVGQYDWYLAAQLKKFKAGVRGVNPLDVTGGQMRPMSMTLVTDDAVNDVVAYVATLPLAN